MSRTLGCLIGLISACGVPGGALPESLTEAPGTRAPEGAPPIAAASPIAVEVTAQGAPTLSGPARIFVVGYRPEVVPQQGGGAPKGPPVFAWMSDPMPAQWPVHLEVPLPPGLTASAILDVDGDDRPGAGDYTSSPIPDARGKGAMTVAFVLDHAIGGGEAPQLGGPGPGAVGSGPAGKGPEAGGSRSGVQIQAAGRTVQEAALTVNPSGPPAPTFQGTVVIAGFEPGKRPTQGQPPAWFWTSGRVDLPWPPTFVVPLPVGLDLLVVEDKDGDGRPSRGDQAAAALPGWKPEGDKPALSVTIDQAFGAGPGPGSEGGPGGPGGPGDVGAAGSPPPAKLPWETGASP